MNIFSYLKYEYDYICRCVEYNNKDININI